MSKTNEAVRVSNVKIFLPNGEVEEYDDSEEGVTSIKVSDLHANKTWVRIDGDKKTFYRGDLAIKWKS